MQISVSNPELQTLVFSGLLFAVLFLSAKSGVREKLFGIEMTNELKGLAILAIIFGHIGYYLSSGHAFLYPLSILAGLGVNIFLFLSGFGLTVSALKNNLSTVSFYKKRLKKIYLPLWIVLTVLILADHFILGINYPGQSILKYYLGYFQRADLYLDINSPLWYFTLILFYYLVFPLLFWRRLPYLSPIVIYLLTVFLLGQSLYVDTSVWFLYKIHILTFPLGMLFALLYKRGWKLKFQGKTAEAAGVLGTIVLLSVFFYLSFNSGVGVNKDLEQVLSLVSMLCLIGLFVLKSFQIKILEELGKLSYEIYLIHWPIMYRYDLLYKMFPAALATLLYLGLFAVLGVILQRVTLTLSRRITF